MSCLDRCFQITPSERFCRAAKIGWQCQRNSPKTKPDRRATAASRSGANLASFCLLGFAAARTLVLVQERKSCGWAGNVALQRVVDTNAIVAEDLARGVLELYLGPRIAGQRRYQVAFGRRQIAL